MDTPSCACTFAVSTTGKRLLKDLCWVCADKEQQALEEVERERKHSEHGKTRRRER
mgnify:CR=1 FL=1